MITPRDDQTNMLCQSEADARAVQAVHGGRVEPYEGSASWLWYRAPAPVARRTDPITSHEAAGRARLRAQEKADLLLIAHADAGTRGLTGDDIETATGFAYEDIGPRRPGLEADEYVVKVLDYWAAVVQGELSVTKRARAARVALGARLARWHLLDFQRVVIAWWIHEAGPGGCPQYLGALLSALEPETPNKQSTAA